MNTTTAEAATKAGVTVATIRTWCRNGVITATKHAGRWIIDAASLAHRIALPALLRPARKTVTLTAETMIALGGRRWQKNGNDRIYLNEWAHFAGIDIDYYKTGNIASATIDGRPIANSRIGKILGAIDKVWLDTADGNLHITHWNADTIQVRYLDGDRDTINLIAQLRAGINAAAAAL